MIGFDLSAADAALAAVALLGFVICSFGFSKGRGKRSGRRVIE
ncbi:hypothetical protein [Sandaracinobacteroides saxicola]|nr:hypothetical protein [Sandaracinobacteroides saxicola]